MRLLRRVRDFAAVAGLGRDRRQGGRRGADAARGRRARPRRAWTGAISRCIAENYGGGPVGVETLAAALGEQRDVIEEVIEPYLMQQGFVQRTPRGRMLTETALSAISAWPVPRAARARRSSTLLATRRSRRRRRMSAHATARLVRGRVSRTQRIQLVPAARLLRGHRRGRHGLSRQLPQIRRARAHRDAAQPRLRASTARAREDGVGFAVRRCAIDYLAPARLDDALVVETHARPRSAPRRSTLRQEIRRDGELLADLDVLVACIGRDGRPRRLPSALRAALANRARHSCALSPCFLPD